MRVLRLCTAAVLAIAAAAALTMSSVAAQQTESRIVGTLVDDTGAALPGATVTVTSKQTGAPRVIVSEGDGSFAVTNLGPGSYTVQVELSGFGSRTRDVVLGLGQVETLDMALGVATLQGFTSN